MFIIAPLTSSPIRADRLWAQERKYIVPRIRIVYNSICKEFFSSSRVHRRDDFIIGGWTETFDCLAKLPR